jgi:hypothetical protein
VILPQAQSLHNATGKFPITAIAQEILLHFKPCKIGIEEGTLAIRYGHFGRFLRVGVVKGRYFHDRLRCDFLIAPPRRRIRLLLKPWSRVPIDVSAASLNMVKAVISPIT